MPARCQQLAGSAPDERTCSHCTAEKTTARMKSTTDQNSARRGCRSPASRSSFWPKMGCPGQPRPRQQGSRRALTVRPPVRQPALIIVPRTDGCGSNPAWVEFDRRGVDINVFSSRYGTDDLLSVADISGSRFHGIPPTADATCQLGLCAAKRTYPYEGTRVRVLCQPGTGNRTGELQLQYGFQIGAGLELPAAHHLNAPCAALCPPCSVRSAWPMAEFAAERRSPANSPLRWSLSTTTRVPPGLSTRRTSAMPAAQSGGQK